MKRIPSLLIFGLSKIHGASLGANKVRFIFELLYTCVLKAFELAGYGKFAGGNNTRG